MKILITGTHFTPAQAVIEELKNTSTPPSAEDSIEIVYVGRKTTLEGDQAASIESQVLSKLAVKFIPIVAGRARRIWELETLLSAIKIPIGFIAAFFIILNQKPDVVLSFGGYVGLPIVFSAWLLSIPVILHEQTLVFGLANSISSLFADKIALSFDKDYLLAKDKQVITGNPIRSQILTPQTANIHYQKIITTSQKERLPLILVMGGNQGSHLINLAIEKTLSKLLKMACVIHQTGQSKFKDFERLSQIKSERYLVKKWIEADDLGAILRETDLVVCRAGANTLYELALLGIPSLTIPLPFLYKNEQVVNARYFQKLGLCEIIYQEKLSEEALLSKITQILKNYQHYQRRAKGAKQEIINDGAKKLVQEILIYEKG